MQIPTHQAFIRFSAKPIDLTQVTQVPVVPPPPSNKPLDEKLADLAKQYGDTAERLKARYDSIKKTLEEVAGVFETEDQILQRIENEIKPKPPGFKPNVSQSMDECGGKLG